MTFFSKIVENKSIVVGAAALAFIGGIAWLYKQYQNDQQEEPVQAVVQKVQFDLQSEIIKLRQRINTHDPSLEDVKQVLKFTADYAKSKTINLTKKLKQERRKRFPKESRMDNFGQYLKFSLSGLGELQRQMQFMQREQQQTLNSIGVSAHQIQKYASQLGGFMQQLIASENQVTEEQVKKNIQMKIEYLEENGDKLIDLLIACTRDFAPQDKQMIPILINVILSDQIYEDYPELDKEEFEMAYQKYKHEITSELMRLEQILMPLMGKLQTSLAAEMGGMGMYGNQYYGDQVGGDGMGGMGGMSEQMMMQQLQQMRQMDPQSYEQFMAMMQAQQHR